MDEWMAIQAHLYAEGFPACIEDSDPGPARMSLADSEATPPSIEMCELLHSELIAVDNILRVALPKFNRADQADIRKHRAALNRLRHQLELHHIRPPLARYKQRGD